MQVTGIAAQPQWERRRAADDAFNIGYAGRIVEPKGVHVLIDAARALPFDNWTLAIHGPTTVDARYVSRLEAMAASDPRIQFKGTGPGDQQSRVFAELDVLVVPSVWYENRPLTILEAQSAGLPVVASRLGGMAELIEHERSGLLFEPGNARDLAAQLARLRSEPALAEQLATQRSRVVTLEQELASRVSTLDSWADAARAERGTCPNPTNGMDERSEAMTTRPKSTTRRAERSEA